MIGWYMSRTNDSVWLIAIVVQLLSHFWLFEIPWTVACHASCPSLSPRVYSNSFPLSCWSHATITSPDIHFSSCPQPFPASWSFPMCRLFASGGQSIEVSASASVLAMNVQGCFSLGLTVWVSFLSKGLSRVFSSTTVRKHQFFCVQPSLWSNSHICT